MITVTLSQNSEDLFSSIGIDSIGFYTSSLYLNLENLAHLRDVDPKKYKYGLMSEEIRIPDWGEDNVTFGLKAAYNAIVRGSVAKKSIDALFVGTETTTYAVKSISNIYKDLLDLPKNTFTQDVSNACAAGTLAIINAVAMIEMGIINKALVIAVDIAAYELNSSGEPTQGAGAVALIISRNPRIALFAKDFGRVSGNVNDFFRSAGEKNAQVFGHYSVDSYLKFQLEAYDSLIYRIGEFYTDYYVFHAPYAKLPLKFMRKLIKERWMEKIDYLKLIKNKKISTIFKRINFDYANQSFLLSNEFDEDIKKLNINEEEENFIKLWIAHELGYSLLPSLKVPSLFGNMYSASIWAEMMYVLEKYAKPNETIYFGSYGSGATCISGIVKVQPQYKSVLGNSLNISKFFYDKQQISVEIYELLKSNPEKYQSKKIEQLKLGKIEPILNNHQYGFKLRYCDCGCNLSVFKGLDYCPKGHHGNNEIYFPIIGTLTAIKEFNMCDLSLLKNGYYIIDGDCEMGSMMEFEIKQIVFDKYYDDKTQLSTTHKVEGLLNWMPVYKKSINEIYEELLKQKSANPLSSWNSLKTPQF